MIKSYFKKQKGVIVTDAIIAILIIMLFVGIIASLMYNIVLETIKTKINSQQIDFATQIFEHIEKSAYADVTVENIIDFVNENYNDELVTVGENVESLTGTYKIGITVTPYNELEGNEEKYDLLKIVTLKIQSEINDKKYTTEMSTVKKTTIEEAEKIINQ